MTSGSAGIGTLILVTWIVGCLTTWILVGFLIIPIAWIWGMCHAHSAAVRWNREHGFIS